MRYIVLTVLGLVLVACSESAATENVPAATKQPTARPGNTAVYERIESLTDCKALQAEFDQADENGRRERANGRSSAIQIAYMEAADDRMKELKCN